MNSALVDFSRQKANICLCLSLNEESHLVHNKQEFVCLVEHSETLAAIVEPNVSSLKKKEAILTPRSDGLSD